MKKSLLLTLFLISALLLSSCGGKTTTMVKEEKEYDPFWLSTTMNNESVLLMKDGDETSGELMFTPTKVLKVTDSSRNIVYKEGTDYTISGRKIIMVSGSTIPYLDKEVLYGISMPSNQGLSTQPTSAYGKEKGYSSVLYTEGSFVFTHQISVTYEYTNSEYTGLRQSYEGASLPNTIKKLEAKEALSIVVFGDSISTGCNASGSGLVSLYDDPNAQYVSWGIAPNIESFPELFRDALVDHYGSDISLLSASKGGMDTNWGKQNAKTRAYNLDYGYDPDLVIIHFGVNDATEYMSEALFKKNIETIITDIRSVSSKTVEFILVGSAMGSKDAVQWGMGTNYFQQLSEISSEFDGVIAVNVGEVQQAFVGRKKYQDLTTNNVNHPNDYVHRLYAMMLASALIKYEE